VWQRLFFYADGQFGTRLLHDLPGVLLSELLVFVVALDGFLDHRYFVLRHIATAVFVVFPGIEIEVRPLGALADLAERAVLHPLNLEDLFDQGLGGNRCIHEGSIDVHLYIATRKVKNCACEHFCLTPDGFRPGRVIFKVWE